jgi:hypothetical protein
MDVATHSSIFYCEVHNPNLFNGLLAEYWNIQVKQSLYRPGEAVRVPGGWGSKIPRQSAHVSGRVLSPTHQLPLPSQEVFLVLISVRGWVDPMAIAWLGGSRQRKILVIPSGTEPATFWLVVHCLNQLHHHGFQTCNSRNQVALDLCALDRLATRIGRWIFIDVTKFH